MRAIGWGASCRAVGRGDREPNSIEIHQGTHTRRDMRVGSTLRAALNLDRFMAGVRARMAGELHLRARAVPHQVPLLTDDARQSGRGRVCACPYQGASRGCRLRGGATLIVKRHRIAHPKGPMPGALASLPGLERATLSAIHGPAHSRPSFASRGLCSRGGILASVTQSARSLSLFVARPEFGDQACDDRSEAFCAVAPRLVGLHDPNYGGNRWKAPRGRMRVLVAEKIA